MLWKTVALLITLAVLPVQADELTDAKRQDIHQLIAQTSAARTALQFAEAITRHTAQTLKQSNPDVPDRVFDVVRSEVMALFEEKMHQPDGPIEMMVPVYHKYFSHDEVRELIAFYNTALGKRTIEAMPKISADGMEVGQEWARSMVPEIRERVRRALEREGLGEQ